MSGRTKNVQHSMQGVFVFVLLGLFAVMSTLMVLLGAQMYRSTVDRATANNQDRVMAAYVRSMVRAEDQAGAVSVQDMQGVKVLRLSEELDDTDYVTLLYCYDGALYENFTSQSEFKPENGTVICPAERFEPKLEGSLLTVDMIDGNGKSVTVQVALRSAQ